ncbi:glycosyltransferase family 2 protein [Flavobacterium sp. YJ01]|uniref:glycosyltransferase family 2 protein n=1 Tax=unclassified Flavobacterium TaxID=196869 RepID=UPI0023E3DC79|nr:glycosyltransferase family 2 protein [Flavobacterium sp. YJ01]WET01227.1 glycosyltransferase family 2 protein [Flavobacterium sp. YJ01]
MIISLVSIIVPCYNQAQYLEEALQSIFDQTYENWECIIVNDGSLDNTEEIVKKWIIKDSRFKYFYKENGGLSSARNLGLENAKGEYIQFLDSDDYIAKTKLQLSIAELQHEDKNIVISNFKMFSQSISDLGESSCDLKLEYFNFKNILFGWDYDFNIPIHCGFFQKSFFDDFRFPEALKAKEDWVMWLSFFKKQHNVYFLNSSLAYYRLHENNMTKDVKHMETNSLKVLSYLKEIVPKGDFIDYLFFILEKRQEKINALDLKIYKMQNSNGYKFLEKLKKMSIVSFLYNKIKSHN